MAFGKKSQAPGAALGKIDNVLGAETRFKGNIIADGNIRIDGLYEGRIETAGNVIIGPEARVLADIVATVVQVWGAVQGNVMTRGRLEILPTGRVFGNLRVASLLIDEGGIFRGECIMGADEEQSRGEPESGA
ncbi:MAG: polymer-forming cytoskeletal protein [Anaerolineales bacterium]